jgi:hypothetical protein
VDLRDVRDDEAACVQADAVGPFGVVFRFATLSSFVSRGRPRDTLFSMVSTTKPHRNLIPRGLAATTERFECN